MREKNLHKFHPDRVVTEFDQNFVQQTHIIIDVPITPRIAAAIIAGSSVFPANRYIKFMSLLQLLSIIRLENILFIYACSMSFKSCLGVA